MSDTSYIIQKVYFSLDSADFISVPFVKQDYVDCPSIFSRTEEGVDGIG